MLLPPMVNEMARIKGRRSRASGEKGGSIGLEIFWTCSRHIEGPKKSTCIFVWMMCVQQVSRVSSNR